MEYDRLSSSRNDMFYNSNAINTLHLELSTKCNASCPMCSRNLDGYGVNPNIKVKNMTFNEFKNFVDVEFISQCSRIMLCGNFGDPLMNPELVMICERIKSINSKVRIEIHTNGGVGSAEVWKSLAKLTFFCRFGIDGLEDSNHVYRRGVKWESVMRNAKTFIEFGGNAEWAFLIFKHNFHQVESAKRLSEEMGFKKFIPKMTSRYYSSNGQIQSKWPVKKNDTEIEFYLESPDSQRALNHYDMMQRMYDGTGDKFREYIDSTEIKCKVKEESSIYMDVNGRLFPCCWLAIDYANKKESTGTVHSILNSNEMSNYNFIPNDKNIIKASNSILFEKIMKSWSSKDRIKKCAHVCGVGFDPFKSQFKVSGV